MAYVPVVLPEKGAASKTGLAINTNCPISSVRNASTDVPTLPQNIGAYSISRPSEFFYEVQDGWISGFRPPDGTTVGPVLLAAFQLYTESGGVKTPINEWVGWYYEVDRWHHDSAGSGVSEHSIIEYTITLRLKHLVGKDGDSLAPYSITPVSQVITLSGTLIDSAGYANVLGYDDRYLGFVLHKGTYDNKPFFGIGINMLQYLYLDDGRVVTNAGSVGFQGIFLQEDAFGNDKKIDPTIKTDPNDEGDPSDEGGGKGDRDTHSDPVPMPGLPNISATAAGFVTLYNPTLAQINALADEIVQDSIWESIKDLFTEPQDYVAGLGIIPVQPVVGASVYPRFGLGIHASVAMPVILNQYTTVDCGSLDITEFYGSAFDYSPNTSIQIFLPYIGFRDLDVDGVMAKTVSVKYNIDVYSGNCVACVLVNGAVHYTFSGNCLQQVPVSGISYNDMVKNGVTLAAALVGAVATGGASAAETAATGAAETTAAATSAAETASAATASTNAVIGSSMVNVMNSKPIISRSGALGGSSGMLSVQNPYIIKKVPRQSWPAAYNTYVGYPTNMTCNLGSLTGFTVVDSINLSGIPGTEEEVAEILSYLKGGVIL